MEGGGRLKINGFSINSENRVPVGYNGMFARKLKDRVSRALEFGRAMVSSETTFDDNICYLNEFEV